MIEQFDDKLINFIEQNQYGTTLSNEQLIDNITCLDIRDPNYARNLTEIIFLLAIKRPIITNFIKLDPRTSWARYMKNNKIENNSMMSNVVKFLSKNDNTSKVYDLLFNLYEQDYENTRFFIHYLNDQKDENKVPYFDMALNSICYYCLNRPFKKLKDLQELMQLPEHVIVEKMEKISQKVGGLKRISGETNTSCDSYSWLTTEFDLDYEFIKSAETSYDIGGGFCTPYLSFLFQKDIISLDKIKPSIIEDVKIKIKLPKNINNEEYISMLKIQKWLPFDVFYDSIDDTSDSYFITSFGFATSTVAPPKDIIDLDKRVNNYYTTYYAIKRIVDLINKNKEVYFIFYGRPTTRVYYNKIIAMKFYNKNLHSYNFYSDAYSCKNNYNFGLNKQIIKWK